MNAKLTIEYKDLPYLVTIFFLLLFGAVYGLNAIDKLNLLAEAFGVRGFVLLFPSGLLFFSLFWLAEKFEYKGLLWAMNVWGVFFICHAILAMILMVAFALHVGHML